MAYSRKYLALVAALSLAQPGWAQRSAVQPAPIIATTCVVASDGEVTLADITVSAANSGTIEVSITPSTKSIAPTVTWHAINTKGAGANDRQPAPETCREVAETGLIVGSDRCIPEPQCRGDDISERIAPAVAAHAINTKGAGSGDRSAAPASANAINTRGEGAELAVEAPADIIATCSVSGSPDNPDITVRLFIADSSKATLADIGFVKRAVGANGVKRSTSGSDAGGYPQVWPRGETRCVDAATGAPSEIAIELLLPAIPK